MVSKSVLPVWGPNPLKLPFNAPDALQDAYRAIERAGKQIDRACHALVVLQNQKEEFVELINKEYMSDVFSTINQSITRDSIVTAVALYDRNGTHLRRSASEILDKKYKLILKNHASMLGVSDNFHKTSRKRLESVVGLVQSPRIAKDFLDLKHYRDKLIAHYDNKVSGKFGQYRSIERIMVLSQELFLLQWRSWKGFHFLMKHGGACRKNSL